MGAEVRIALAGYPAWLVLLACCIPIGGCQVSKNWLASHADGAMWGRAANPLRREHVPEWVLFATLPYFIDQDHRGARYLAKKKSWGSHEGDDRGDQVLAVLMTMPLLPVLAGVSGVAGTRREGLELLEVSIETLALTSLTVEGLKAAVGRERPNDNADIGGRLDPSKQSFPSGHAAAAMASATLTTRWLRQHLRTSWPFEMLLYGGVVFVAVTRVENDKHFPTDTLAGAIIGGYWANTVWDAHHGVADEPGIFQQRGTAQLHVVPLEGGIGLVAGWQF